MTDQKQAPETPARLARFLEIDTLTASDPVAEGAAFTVQYAVLDPDGLRTAYSDQRWVRSGQCVRDGSHPNGRIQKRRIDITYGPWMDAPTLNTGGELPLPVSPSDKDVTVAELAGVAQAQATEAAGGVIAGDDKAARVGVDVPDAAYRL